LSGESICEYFVTKKHVGLAEREIHVLVYGYYDFPKPSVDGFPRIVAAGTSFSPLPCQAWLLAPTAWR
jgi:hypothetical protein